MQYIFYFGPDGIVYDSVKVKLGNACAGETNYLLWLAAL
jgi:hypothetical protein